MSMNPLKIGESAGLSIGGTETLRIGGGQLSVSSRRKEEEAQQQQQPSSTSVALASAQGSNTGPLQVGGQINVQRWGSALLTEHLDEGMLSVREDKERRDKTDKMIISLAGQIAKAREQIDTAIQSFRETSRDLDQRLKELALTQIDRALKGEKIVQEDADQTNFVLALSKQVSTRFLETATALMDLEKINNAGKLEQFGQVVEMVFQSRFKELELLSARLKLLREHENHELALETAVRNQFLKEQTQAFDQWMQTVKFASEEERAQSEIRWKEREQAIGEEKDLKELAIKEMKLNQENEREEQRLKAEEKLKEKTLEYNHSLEEKKIESNERVEENRIAGEATVEFAKAATSVVSGPKCSIM